MQSYLTPAETVESKPEVNLSPSSQERSLVTTTPDEVYCDHLQQTRTLEQYPSQDGACYTYFTFPLSSEANFDDGLYNPTPDELNFYSATAQQGATTASNSIEADRGSSWIPSYGYASAADIDDSCSLPLPTIPSWQRFCFDEGRLSGSNGTPVPGDRPYPERPYGQWQTEHTLAQSFENPTYGVNVSSHNQSLFAHHTSPDSSVWPDTEVDGAIERRLPIDLIDPAPSQHTSPVVGGQTDRVDYSGICYAQLLKICLMEAPDRTRSLRDIYEWFRINVKKIQDDKGTGWQNSIRHNLSMNAAFEKAPAPNDAYGKKTSYWRLTDDAVRDGVAATTRYRKSPKHRAQQVDRAQQGDQAAASRQNAGRKGGQQTRRGRSHRQTAPRGSSRRPREHQLQAQPITPSPIGYSSPSEALVQRRLPVGFPGSPMPFQAHTETHFGEHSLANSVNFRPLDPSTHRQETAGYSTEQTDLDLGLPVQGGNVLPRRVHPLFTSVEHSTISPLDAVDAPAVIQSGEGLFGYSSTTLAEYPIPPPAESDLVFTENDVHFDSIVAAPSYFEDGFPADLDPNFDSGDGPLHPEHEF